MSVVRLSILSVLSFVIVACGGGGGGGGGSSSGNDSSGVRILHGALDLSPVDVLGTSEAVRSAFRGDAFFRRLVDGTSSVIIHRANIPGRTVFQPGVTADSEVRQTILLFGQETDGTLGVRVQREAFPEIPEGMAAVRLVNAVHDTGTVSARFLGEVTQAVGEGGFSEYIFVPTGDVPFGVTETGDDGAFLTGTKTFEAGRFYTLFVAGEDGLFATQRFYEDD